MVNINMSNSHFNLLKKVTERYESNLIEHHNIHRDSEFQPYHYDYFLNKIINSDDLVQ